MAATTTVPSRATKAPDLEQLRIAAAQAASDREAAHARVTEAETVFMGYQRLVDPNVGMVSDGPQPTPEETWTARAEWSRARETLAAVKLDAIAADRRDSEARAALNAGISASFDVRLRPAYTKNVRDLRVAARGLMETARIEAEERTLLGGECRREQFSNAWLSIKAGLIDHWEQTLRSYGLIEVDSE